MRLSALLLPALLVACVQRDRPPTPPDTVTVDSGQVAPDSAPALDTGDSLYWREQRHSASAAPLHVTVLGARWLQLPVPSVAVDTVADTTSGDGYTIRRVAERTVTVGVAVIATDTLVRPPPPPLYTGRPFGPQSLWATYTDVLWGPAPFTFSKNYTAAGGVAIQIAAARAKKHRLVLTMTGGPHSNYLTNGRFDLGKWRQKQATFNTAAIKKAIADGVADGTVIGNVMIDEPEHASWGRSPDAFSKPLLDQMAGEVRAVFPTLPVGNNVGPPAYKWHTTETFQKLDFIIYQYNTAYTSGNITGWRDGVLAQAAKDHVVPFFSLNVLDGGVQDKDGHYDCTGAGQLGPGTYAPNCRMTAAQVLSYGKALSPAGCGLMLWEFDRYYVTRSDVQTSLKALATAQAALAPMKCAQ